MIAGNKITSVEIANLWGEYTIRWESLHPDVNILVGGNGSGKSTLLRILSAIITANDLTPYSREIYENLHEMYGKQLTVCIHFNDGNTYAWNKSKNARNNRNLTFGDLINLQKLSQNPLKSLLISTFDTPIKDIERLKKNESSLDQELDYLIYQRKKDDPVNFTNYRLKATMPGYSAPEIAANITNFFADIIDPFFANTDKRIAIDGSTNDLVFHGKKNNIIKLTDLSSGEKQILIIFFRLFLMEKEPYIVMMDEPEVSLHIEWQQNLIEVMQRVNPNCQFIIATHSPSIFGKGWMDKLHRLEKLKLSEDDV